MIVGTNSKKPWSDLDRLIMEAYQIFLGELCPQCGQPRYICGNESNDIQFRVHEEYCSAKAAIDKREEANTKSKKNMSGITLRPEAYSVDGIDLVTYREPYYLAERKKREARAPKSES